MKNTKKGFTIVELVIVIAVIAILAAVLIPTFSSVTSSARASAAQQQAKAGLDSIIALTEGSLPDGTTFVVTNSDDATVDYVFAYTGNKLTQVENSKIDIETYGKTSDYAVYVTAAVFGTDENAPTKKTAVEKLLLNSIKTITGYSDITAATINTGEAPTNGYYTLTITGYSGEGDPATFRVYYTSDIQETMVVFVGNDN